jgi:hypothetical protein
MSFEPSTTAAFAAPVGCPAAAARLVDTLAERVAIEPLNAIATGIFVLAIVHTFAAARFARLAHHPARRDEHADRERRPRQPSVRAELLHFVGEVEVVRPVGRRAAGALTWAKGWAAAKHYFNDTVIYTEPLFVIVIMALASTRPVVGFAESPAAPCASLGGETPAAWWFTILTVGPCSGSFITEPPP